MNNITKLLKETTDHPFRVHTLERESYELFFVHRKVETVRATDTTTTKVTVYADHDGCRGEYTFTVYPSDSEAVLTDKIRDAEKKAALIKNKAFSLPAGERFEREISSSLSAEEPAALAAKIGRAVFAADVYEGGSINALEVFLYHDTVTVENSEGLYKQEKKYHAMLEAIPTWNLPDESVELYEAYRFTELNEAEITAEIDARMQEVRDRCHATKPEGAQADVVLNAKELETLFEEITNGLQYSSVYAKSNPFSRGDAVQKVAPDGDPLTLTMRGEMKGSTASALFDADGVSLGERTVIRGGQVVDYFGGNRFAQYLGEPVTGLLPCMDVETGTLTDAELESGRYFECVSMSGLQVDVVNDYIGGEVRLAYLHENGRKTPLTGISISGKLSEVLSDMRLSDRRTIFGAYGGPAKARLRHIEIV